MPDATKPIPIALADLKPGMIVFAEIDYSYIDETVGEEPFEETRTDCVIIHRGPDPLAVYVDDSPPDEPVGCYARVTAHKVGDNFQVYRTQRDAQLACLISFMEDAEEERNLAKKLLARIGAA